MTAKHGKFPRYVAKNLLYSYDYGDGWEIVVSRMTDSKDDEIACVETVGTNAEGDIEIFFIGMLDRYAGDDS